MAYSFSKLSLFFGALIFSVSLCVATSNAQSDAPKPHQVQQGTDSLLDIRRAHDERPHDPPIFVDKSKRQTTPDQLSAFGKFNGIQVNVDPNGNNIANDAANEPSISK